MADLWKNGDVITAEKLNRLILTKATMTAENNQMIISLEITPNDIFDENNNLNSFIVIDGAENHETTILSSFIFGYSSEYDVENGISVLRASDIFGKNTIDFDAPSRTDYFTAVLDNNA